MENYGNLYVLKLVTPLEISLYKVKYSCIVITLHLITEI